jgi:hypothetical protein
MCRLTRNISTYRGPWLTSWASFLPHSHSPWPPHACEFLHVLLFSTLQSVRSHLFWLLCETSSPSWCAQCSPHTPAQMPLMALAIRLHQLFSIKWLPGIHFLHGVTLRKSHLTDCWILPPAQVKQAWVYQHKSRHLFLLSEMWILGLGVWPRVSVTAWEVWSPEFKSQYWEKNFLILYG